MLGHASRCGDARRVHAPVAVGRGPHAAGDRAWLPRRGSAWAEAHVGVGVGLAPHVPASPQVRAVGDGESACKRDPVIASRRPVTIHLCGLPGGAPLGRGGRAARASCSALLRVGFAEPPGSPRTLVRSYRTVSPSPVTGRPAHRRSLSVALSVRSPRPGSRQHPALWSPDFPRRDEQRRGHPADSPSTGHSTAVSTARSGVAGHALVDVRVVGRRLQGDRRTGCRPRGRADGDRDGGERAEQVGDGVQRRQTTARPA